MFKKTYQEELEDIYTRIVDLKQFESDRGVGARPPCRDSNCKMQACVSSRWFEEQFKSSNERKKL